MKPIIQKLEVLMAVLWVSVSAFAYDFEVDGICYDITSFTELTVKASAVSESVGGTLTIPSFVEFKGKELCVTTVGESFAENNNKINTLIIGDSIATIESKAFKHCAEILSVTIKGCASIGSECFKGCSKINNITLPASLYSIGDRGFEGCISLTNVALPEQLKEIGSYAFCQCSSLISISLPNIDRILDYTFYGCTALKNIDLSENLTYIGTHAFSGVAVDSFIIPNKVTSIGANVLSDCANLQTLTIGSGISILSSNPINNCPKLRELRFADSDTPLEITFNGEVIQSFVYRASSVNNDVYVSIYNGGFQDLNIEKLYLGRTVKYPASDPSSKVYSTISTNPFTRNEYIKEITIGEKVNNLPFVNIDIYYNGVLPVSYSNAFGYFEGCEALEKIYIYGNLKDISDRMFYGTKINSIIMPNTISSIGASAFEHCVLLQEVYIGKNCDKIGLNAFSNCNALSSLNLYCLNPPSYSTGFDNSQYINMVLNIPPNTIDEYQNSDPWKNFWNLKEDENLLTEFIIDPLKFEISNCYNVSLVNFTDLEIDTLNIPSSVIYNDNKYNVTSLGFEGVVLNNCNKIYLPNSIKELPSAIFKEWKNLKDIILGDVEVINDNCFANCKSLRSLIIPATCNSIGNDCFRGCSSLEDIQFDISEHTITLGANT